MSRSTSGVSYFYSFLLLASVASCRAVAGYDANGLIEQGGASPGAGGAAGAIGDGGGTVAGGSAGVGGTSGKGGGGVVGGAGGDAGDMGMPDTGVAGSDLPDA